MRIVGKISTTVQTVANGLPIGTIQLKTTVVRDLVSLFATEALPGSQLCEKLAKFEIGQDLSILRSMKTNSKKPEKIQEHSKPEPTKPNDA